MVYRRCEYLFVPLDVFLYFPSSEYCLELFLAYLLCLLKADKYNLALLAGKVSLCDNNVYTCSLHDLIRQIMAYCNSCLMFSALYL